MVRIGVLASKSGLSTRTIRFYERAGLLPEPPRTASGYREFPPEASARLGFIRDAQAAGLTLAEIRGILVIRDLGSAPCQHVSVLIGQHLHQISLRMAELHAAREVLRELSRRAAATDPASCTGTSICTILAAVQAPAGPNAGR